MNAGEKKFAVMDLARWKWAPAVRASVLAMLAPTQEHLRNEVQIEGECTPAAKCSPLDAL